MYELSANVEWLFTDQSSDISANKIGDRVEAAATLGISAVEIWTWRTKDIDQLARALNHFDVALQAMCTEPMGELVDPSTHATFLSGLADSAVIAERLRCPFLVVMAGDSRPSVSREDQHQAIVDSLRRAATILEPHNVTLLLESLNSRVDHTGTYLDSTTECLDILEEVNSPHVRLLYDLYHSLVMGEQPETVLNGRSDLLAHVQVADIPGRHEPGSGIVDWRDQLSTLQDLGYSGRIGLEYMPRKDTASSLEFIRRIVSELP